MIERPADASTTRNTLLVSMTDDVAHLVLEDNRLQTLALSIMEQDGAQALPSYVRLIEIFESAGRLDRVVEGLADNGELLRRAPEGHGLTRPELAVLLATAKLALQDAIEHTDLGTDDELAARSPRRLPAGDAQEVRHRDRRASPARRDRRDQARQPHHQPARRAPPVRAGRGGRRGDGRHRGDVRRGRAAVRSRRALGRDRDARRCPRPGASRCSTRSRSRCAARSPTCCA